MADALTRLNDAGQSCRLNVEVQTADLRALLVVVEAAKRWRAHQWQSSGHAKMDAALVAAVDALAPQEQTP